MQALLTCNSFISSSLSAYFVCFFFCSVLFCLLLSGAECSIDLWFVYMLCMKCERVCLVPGPATVQCSVVQCSQCSAGMGLS
jgi:hypothetical protein